MSRYGSYGANDRENWEQPTYRYRPIHDGYLTRPAFHSYGEQRSSAGSPSNHYILQRYHDDNESLRASATKYKRWWRSALDRLEKKDRRIYRLETENDRLREHSSPVRESSRRDWLSTRFSRRRDATGVRTDDYASNRSERSATVLADNASRRQFAERRAQDERAECSRVRRYVEVVDEDSEDDDYYGAPDRSRDYNQYRGATYDPADSD